MRWLHMLIGIFLGITFMVSCSIQQDGEGLVFDTMGNVIAAIALLAEEVGFNNINTKLSADNMQAALEEEDAKVEEIKSQLEDAIDSIGNVEDSVNNQPIYSLQCPSDTQKLGTSCIENTKRQPATFYDGLDTCVGAGRRLCTVLEIASLCRQQPNHDLAGREWTASLHYRDVSFGSDMHSLALSNPNFSCNIDEGTGSATDINNSFTTQHFRCCSEVELIVQ